MCNVVQLCLAAYNILLMHAYMKPRISPSWDRSCVKMADRFQSVSLFIKKKLGDRMIKRLLISVIAKYRDLSVAEFILETNYPSRRIIRLKSIIHF